MKRQKTGGGSSQLQKGKGKGKGPMSGSRSGKRKVREVRLKVVDYGRQFQVRRQARKGRS